MFQDIKKMINPNRHINKDTEMKQLSGKNLMDIIDIFEDRIRYWYIEAGEYLLQNKPMYNFVVITICCIIIDTLSQYEQNLVKSSGKEFKNFLRNYIPEFNNTFQNSGQIQFFDTNNRRGIGFKKITIDSSNKNDYDYAWAFWEAFRCGIVHNGLVLSFCRHNPDTNNKIIKESVWGYNNLELTINPKLLFEGVKKAFESYIKKLKTDSSLKEKFQEKFFRDFGWKDKTFTNLTYP